MTASEQVSFARDIRPLFRDEDVDEMQWAFDLTDYADVCRYAEPILDRVAEGTMPCDAPWPAERVELFQRWVDGGTQP